MHGGSCLHIEYHDQAIVTGSDDATAVWAETTGQDKTVTRMALGLFPYLRHPPLRTRHITS